MTNIRPNVAVRKTNKTGVLFVLVISALCAGPIIWEIGLMHHDLEHFAGAVLGWTGGNQFLALIAYTALAYTGLRAPWLVVSSIGIAVAVRNKVPNWAKIAVWLVIASAVPAAIQVLRLTAVMSNLNSPKRLESVYKKDRAAFVTITSISWCAIQYKQAHPGYPATLDELSKFPCRRRWAVSDAPDHRISFDLRDDSSGFLVTATPNDPTALTYDSDNSGLIYLWSRSGGEYHRVLADPNTETGDYSLRQQEFEVAAHLYNCLQAIARQQPEVGFPEHLMDVASQENRVRGCYDPEEFKYFNAQEPDTLRLTNYQYTYRPGPVSTSGQRNTFELYAQCRSYGIACIFNLYANQDSDLHRTTDDRAATLEDPVEPADLMKKKFAP